jgi:hypothetical protein
MSCAPKIIGVRIDEEDEWRTSKWEESLVIRKKWDAKSLHGIRSAASSISAMSSREQRGIHSTPLSRPLARSD